jgi:hypothetical protein
MSEAEAEIGSDKLLAGQICLSHQEMHVKNALGEPGETEVIRRNPAPLSSTNTLLISEDRMMMAKISGELLPCLSNQYSLYHVKTNI